MSSEPQAKSTPPSMTVAGLMCVWNPKYPAVVQPGKAGYPAPEDGPTAVPPGCAPGLPTIDFSGGAWQH